MIHLCFTFYFLLLVLYIFEAYTVGVRFFLPKNTLILLSTNVCLGNSNTSVIVACLLKATWLYLRGCELKHAHLIPFRMSIYQLSI